MDLKIGKFTLETLTTGMYESPKDMYREYIQNAADSIDNAINCGILSKGKENISININEEESLIEISDNGMGVSAELVEQYLLNIGDSAKYNTNSRGFRGIGRLAGLAYCDELTFTTSFRGEELKSIVKFNAKELRKNLYDHNNKLSLEEIFLRVVSIIKEKETKSKHYFSVLLSGVANVDGILDFKELYNYLSQVSPVPFSPEFTWKQIVLSKLKYRGVDLSEYNIFLSNKEKKTQIFKNYTDGFIADRARKAEDKIEDIEDLVLTDSNGNVLAVLWYGKTNYSGTIQNELIKGIRLRKGNIQLGEKNILNIIFKDERFNGWLVGELHIVSSKLVPNARRDNVEKNSEYFNLMGQLRSWASRISSEIRKISIERNTDRTNKKIEKLVVAESCENDIPPIEVIPEIYLNDKQEYDDIAHTELLNQLDILIKQKQSLTKYKALNIQKELTIEEKKILEVVFDIIMVEDCKNADKLVSSIIKNFTKQYLLKK